MTRTAEERLRAAAEATEKLVRQYVMLLGGRGRDEQTVIRSLDALRAALHAIEAERRSAQRAKGVCPDCHALMASGREGLLHASCVEWSRHA